MESSIAEFLRRQSACELLPTACYYPRGRRYRACACCTHTCAQLVPCLGTSIHFCPRPRFLSVPLCVLVVVVVALVLVLRSSSHPSSVLAPPVLVSLSPDLFLVPLHILSRPFARPSYFNPFPNHSLAHAPLRNQLCAGLHCCRLYLHRITSKEISELTRGQQ